MFTLQRDRWSIGKWGREWGGEAERRGSKGGGRRGGRKENSSPNGKEEEKGYRPHGDRQQFDEIHAQKEVLINMMVLIVLCAWFWVVWICVSQTAAENRTAQMTVTSRERRLLLCSWWLVCVWLNKWILVYFIGYSFPESVKCINLLLCHHLQHKK